MFIHLIVRQEAGTCAKLSGMTGSGSRQGESGNAREQRGYCLGFVGGLIDV